MARSVPPRSGRARFRLATALGVVCLSVLAGGVAHAQQLTASEVAPITKTDVGWLVRTQVNEVTVLFTAKDGRKFVRDLKPEDVSVRDNHQEPKIVSFHDEHDLPLRLGLLIDQSSSVTRRFHFEQRAAARFLQETMEQSSDQAFVAGFENSMHVIQGFTNDHGHLSAAIEKLKPAGGTALWDSAMLACKMLHDSAQGNTAARVLVLLTDGDDNASTASEEDLINAAQMDEVTVYVVNTSDTMNQFGFTLKHIAETTGGRMFLAGGLGQLSKAFGKVGEEIRARYSLSYVPVQFVPDGRFHKIQLIARRGAKTLKVHARKGYYALARIDPQP
jgi:VWFA-related protein